MRAGARGRNSLGEMAEAIEQQYNKQPENKRPAGVNGIITARQPLLETTENIS